ncbi:MAG: hypothetical protein NC115_12425 [Bacteroidales bacterium]|nr:hypothetical protein [Bacteroidales bacterium]
MKRLRYIIPAIVLMAGTSCSKTQEGPLYNPNYDDCKEIHFIQSSIEKEFPTDFSEGTIDVQIARPGNKGSYTVHILNRGTDSGLFTAPETVTIPDGEYSVTVPVSVDLSRLLMGGNVKTTLYIRDRDAYLGDNSAYVSQYTDKMDVSASFELTWEPYYRINEDGEEVRQTATFNYNAFYTGRTSGLEVDKAAGANIFRVNDWASGVGFKFILKDDNTCVVPAQSIGYFNSNYNEYVQVSDMAVYQGDNSMYSAYPCTYDGKGTFSFYLIYYVSEGYFARGEETLVFETDADETPLMAIDFDGEETTETGFKAPRLSFYINEYVKSYKATVIPGDITADEAALERVRTMLINGEAPGPYPVLDQYSDYSELWSIPGGNFTAVALAYDEAGEPCRLFHTRFTFDPDGQYLPKTVDFSFYRDETGQYSQYSSLLWHIQTANAVSMKYLCIRTDIFDYLVNANRNMPLAEFVASNGNAVSAEIIDAANGDGFTTAFQNLAEGLEYTLAVAVFNSFGDVAVEVRSASTLGHSAAEFDRTRTMDDFLGAFKATATTRVTGATSTTASTSSYRVDIYRQNSSQVIISGMSDMRDFTPELVGYYDEELHAIIVGAQPCGMYRSNYAYLGMSDGFSTYWGGCDFAIGYIGDTLYWLSAPGSTADVYQYQFLLFTSEQPTSNTYTRESVGSKSYSNVKMQPFALSPSSAPSRVRTMECSGQHFESYLCD